MGNTLFWQKAEQNFIQFSCKAIMVQISVFRVYVGNDEIQSCMTPTEAISMRITLKRKLFIQVQFYFMGWKRQQQGILIPNFTVPFWTHQRRYKQKYANSPVARKPALPLSKPRKSQFKKGIKGRLNPFAIFPKILRNNIFLYICKTQSNEVTRKTTPSSNLTQGTIGLESQNLSQRLKSQTYSSIVKNFALNYVSLLSNYLLPLHLLNHPAYELAACSSSFFFIYSPSLIKTFTAVDRRFLVQFIYAVLLAFGRFLKSFIMSNGKANKPTPPQITTQIHPKNDIIAMIYTAKDAYSQRVTSDSF